MIEITKNGTVEVEGNILGIIVDLDLIVEKVVKSLMEDCPNPIRQTMKDIIKEGLNFAVDEAFK